MAAALLIYTCVSSFSASTREKDAQTAAYLASPRQHELYLTDLAAIPDSGFDTDESGAKRKGHAYGIMKLREVKDDELIFVISTTASDRQSRPSYESFEYDEEYPLAISRQKVVELRRNGIISEVRRTTLIRNR